MFSPTLRSQLTPKVIRPLATFLEPVADQVEKLIDGHPDGLCFFGVKISESLGPRSALEAFSSVLAVLE
jgi:hypothetical protein